MLNELLSPDRILLDAPAATLEEATLLCGQLLVDTGCAEPGYPAAMVETVRELGSFIVMAPFTALPHAAPEQGGIRPAAALLRPKGEIPTESKNGPVRLILGFCGSDGNSHMQVLSQIAAELSRPGCIEALLQADSADAILSI